MDSLLIESDSPDGYISNPSESSEVNEPLSVMRVAEVIAKVKNMSADRLHESVGANFSELLR